MAITSDLKTSFSHAYGRLRLLPWVRRCGRAALRTPVVGRVVRHTLRSFLSLSTSRVWTACPYGEVYVEPDSESGYITGLPEPEVCEVLLQHLKPGMCFYDLGAHIGFYSLMASAIVGPSGSVFAFEPDPDNFAVCLETAARNKLANVEVNQSAVWERDEPISFHPQVGNRMSGGLDVASRSRVGWTDKTVTVQAISLDEFVRTHRAPDIVKMDVEGAEQHALRGAKSLLSSSQAVWLIEIHNFIALRECTEILNELRFKVRQLGDESEPPLHLLASR